MLLIPAFSRYCTVLACSKIETLKACLLKSDSSTVYTRFQRLKLKEWITVEAKQLFRYNCMKLLVAHKPAGGTNCTVQAYLEFWFKQRVLFATRPTCYQLPEKEKKILDQNSGCLLGSFVKSNSHENPCAAGQMRWRARWLYFHVDSDVETKWVQLWRLEATRSRKEYHCSFQGEKDEWEKRIIHEGQLLAE